MSSSTPDQSPSEGAEPIRYEVDAGLATITFNRPDAMNALDTAAKDALVAAVQEAADDDAVRCLLVTGTGRAFCVGQDLRELRAQIDGGRAGLSGTVQKHYNPIALALSTMNKPVVAGVNGVAAGAGTSIAMAADLRVVARSAGFNLAFANVALSADTGASWWLPRLVGVAKAKELLLMPRTVPAEEALQIGLATEVVDDAELPARALEVARRLADGPTLAYGSIRRAVTYALSHDLAAALEHEGTLMALTGSTADHQEAVSAFLAKRTPRFEGR